MDVSDAERWLRTRRRLVAPRIRLVCLPYAGGGSTVFRSWGDRLPPDVEVLAVQLPGRQDRFVEPGLTRVPALVERITEALATLPPAPTALYGHSLGGLLAFEVARALSASGRAPMALVAGAARAPHLPPWEPPMHPMAEGAFLEAVHRRYGTPWILLSDPDLMSLALPALRVDIEAFETYAHVAGPPLDVPVTVLRGLQDTRHPAESALAWQDLTRRPVTLHTIDAGHFFIDTHADQVLKIVGDALGG